ESAEGEPCLMSWAEAASYCQAEGGHLPTARELAAPLSLLGTITVAREEMREPVPEGFYLVPNRDPDGSTYDFYMNHLGYQRPPGARAELLWTASIPPQHPAYAHVLYTAWGGGG